jgi:hypothetical protein
MHFAQCVARHWRKPFEKRELAILAREAATHTTVVAVSVDTATAVLAK